MSLLKTVFLTQIMCSEGKYVKGKWVEGESIENVFKGTWQPANGQTMELLPEGKRNQETYKCFAPINMNFTSADSEAQLEGDEIIWEGKTFEVITASKWNNGIIPHWELVCVRKKEGEK